MATKRESMSATIQRLRTENQQLVRGLNAYRDAYRHANGCRGGDCGCRVHEWEREFGEFVAGVVRYCIATRTNS